MTDVLSNSIASLDAGPLTEDGLKRHVFPLFSGVLANQDVYLANHSLGRPLDRTGDDLREGYILWQRHLGDAWDAWLEERENYRSRIAALIGAAQSDCIVPKTSAGQGLRAVLNSLPGRPKVISTTGEFDSIDLILKQYAAVGRIELQLIDGDPDGRFRTTTIADHAHRGVDLVVVSQVMFMTGQVMNELDLLAQTCHRNGARLLVDAYHSVGVFPVDVTAIDADFMIGGCYKYLRGGPGACFLYLSPASLASGLRPVDTGWFAKESPFAYERPDPPKFAPGGNAFLESTPPVLTFYQARAGQRFALEVGIARLRDYGLDRLRKLQAHLKDCGVAAQGADENHGGFLTVKNPDAAVLAKRLASKGVQADARSVWLRLSPDCLTLDEEMRRAAEILAAVMAE
jgi:kynureninase